MPGFVKDLAHYGISALMVLIGGLAEMGVHIPGVHLDDPSTMFWAGLGVFVAGLKGGWLTSK